MKRLALILSLSGLVLAGQSPGLAAAKGKAAEQTLIRGVQIWATPDHTRVVLDTQGPASHQLSKKQPDQLVLEIKNASLQGALPTNLDKAPVIASLQATPVRAGRDLRMVVDLKQGVVAKAFILPATGLQGQRLVLDLETKAAASAAPQEEAEASAPAPVKLANNEPGSKTRGKNGKSSKKGDTAPKSGVKAPSAAMEPRELVVAVDAGHGGEDPGAIGPTGVQEKSVTLAIAKRLQRQINAQPGMRAVLTRKGDYFIPLRQRIQKARDAKADLFVSIHADSVDDPSVGGASVYTLSQRGASSEAARLQAEKENRADLISGVELSSKDPQLTSMLIEMAQSGTMEASQQLARQVLGRLKGVGKTRKSQVQHAGFAVLKAPNIPSVLVETAYLSNPVEEGKLQDPAHQERLAEALTGGIRKYFAKHPPARDAQVARVDADADTDATLQHKVAHGETLSEVAQQYRVARSDLRSANHLNGDNVRVGQVLRIPKS